MARAKRGERRERGSGTITRRGDRHYLLLKVGDRTFQRLITDANGDRVTTIEAAREHAPALAQVLRAQANKNLAGMPVERLAEMYERYLPTYSKHGLPHPDATGRVPVAPSTLYGNLRSIRAFVEWMGREYPKVRFLEAIGKEHAAGYMATLADGKPASYNRRLAEMRHVFAVIPYGSNPFAALDQKGTAIVARDSTRKRAFTPDELVIMQAKATGWIRPAMFIGFHSGLRLGDVATLRWTEIDGDGFIKRTQRKSGKVEIVYAPEILPEVDAWRQAQGDGGSEFLFPTHAKAYLGIGRKADRNLAVVQFQRFLRGVCGFQTCDESGAVVLGFHSLRASNATYGRRAGETLAEVQRRLAHSTSAVTAGYIQLNDADIRRELRSTHVPLALPGTVEAVDPQEAADRVRLAAAMAKLPINRVRQMLSGLEGSEG
jgi:integrase